MKERVIQKNGTLFLVESFFNTDATSTVLAVVCVGSCVEQMINIDKRGTAWTPQVFSVDNIISDQRKRCRNQKKQMDKANNGTDREYDKAYKCEKDRFLFNCNHACTSPKGIVPGVYFPKSMFF